MNFSKANLKRLMKKESVRVFLVSCLIALVLLIIRRNAGFFRNVSDFLCMVGLMHIVVGASRYIRNVGLFKTFSYMGYRRRWKKTGALDGEAHPMSLADYTQNVIMDETRQKPVKLPMFLGLASCLLSYAVVFVC